MGHVKYTLKKPIRILKANAEGPELVDEITSLTIRDEVVTGDLRGIPMREPMHFDDIAKLLGRLAGQPDNVINKLSLVDLLEVGPLVMGFTGLGPTTGNPPSSS